MVCSWHDTWIAHTGKRGMNVRYPGTGPVHLLAPQHKGKILTATLIRYDTWHFDGLRVVPRFPSGIVERAKRECAWKSPHVRKARRGGEREKLGTTGKAQAFDPSRPNDFGVWSSYPLSNDRSVDSDWRVFDRCRQITPEEPIRLCVVRVTDKAKSLAFVGSPRGKMRDYTLKTKAGSLIVKIKY